MNASASEGSLIPITGKTRVLGIVAHPTAHVKAPPGINRIARERGRDAVMVPFNVAPRDLAKCVEALRHMQSFDGAIITVPHKQTIIPLCDEITSHAAAVGAVNILRREKDGRLIGGQLDGIGFVEGLRGAGVNLAEKSAYLAGAGGAANAIAFALAEAQIGSLTLFNRSEEKAILMKKRLIASYEHLDVRIGSKNAAGHDVIVNATTLGMHQGDALPFETASLSTDMVVAEVIMEPEMTPLLLAAQRAGCKIHLGRRMLEHQLQLMADFMGL